VLLTYAFYALTAYFFVVLFPTYGDVDTISRTTKDGFYPSKEIVKNTFPLNYMESEGEEKFGPTIRAKGFIYPEENGRTYSEKDGCVLEKEQHNAESEEACKKACTDDDNCKFFVHKPKIESKKDSKEKKKGKIDSSGSKEPEESKPSECWTSKKDPSNCKKVEDERSNIFIKIDSFISQPNKNYTECKGTKNEGGK
jgi:hypothetical protein